MFTATYYFILLLSCIITAGAEELGYTEQVHEGWLLLPVSLVISTRDCWFGCCYMVAG